MNRKTKTVAKAKIAKATTKRKQSTMTMLSQKTYGKILTAVKKYNSRKTGLVSRTTGELATMIGCTSQTIRNGLKNMVTNKVVRKVGRSEYYLIK